MDKSSDEVQHVKVVLDLPVLTVEVTVDGNNCSLTYLEVTPDTISDTKPQVLLLHGARFTASTWNTECGTLAMLKKWGYRAVAIDLKPEAPIDKLTCSGNKARAELIHELVEKLQLSKVVLISPSKSGQLSIPYIMDSSYRDEIEAYIPIAPVIDSAYSAEDFAKLSQLKALVVQGENDNQLGDSSQKLLMRLPRDPQLLLIPGAGHACYLDNPHFWHLHLRQFLDSL